MKKLLSGIAFFLFLAPLLLTAQNPEASRLLETGNTFYKSREIDSALFYFNMAVEADPASAVTYFRRALAKEKSEDMNGAIADYQAAIAISPMPVYYNNIGMILTLQEKYEESILQFDNALELDPDYFQALFNKGISYHHLGNREEACKYVGQARELGLLFADEYLNQFCK